MMMMMMQKVCLLNPIVAYSTLRRQSSSVTHSMNQLPIIDASKLEYCKTTREQIAKACNQPGAFYLKNHRIISRQLLTELQCFFGSNKNAVKEKAKPEEGYFGYFKVGGEITLGKRDWKEGIYYRAEYPDQRKKLDTIKCNELLAR